MNSRFIQRLTTTFQVTERRIGLRKLAKIDTLNNLVLKQEQQARVLREGRSIYQQQKHYDPIQPTTNASGEMKLEGNPFNMD